MNTTAKRLSIITGLLVMTLATGCIPARERLLDSDSSQLALRSIQTRAFDTDDREETIRTIMATLLDLGFILEAGDVSLGTVSAVKGGLRITVNVRQRSEEQSLVRANCQLQMETVKDPVPYQRFFASLSKAMFLEAQRVE